MRKWMVLAITLLLCLGSFGKGYGQDISERILTSLRAGSSKELAKNFASSVSVAVKQEDGVYSKFQAELVISEFFRQNKPTKVSLAQRMTNNAANAYYVFSLKTHNQTYRVFTKLIENKDTFYISEIRFELATTK